LSNDDRGVTAIVFALALVPVMGMVGLSVDYSLSLRVKAHLQASTDAAALAMASASGKTDNERVALGQTVLNGTFNNDLIRASLAGSDLSVNGDVSVVTATANVPLAFGGLVGIQSLAVGASSKSSAGSKATNSMACILAVGPGGTGVSTNSSIITSDCGLYSNSSSSSAFDFRGNSRISTQFNCVVGRYSKDSQASVSPNVKTGCSVMSDPFASMAAPSNATASCRYNGKRARDGDILSPGVYCSGLEIDSGASVTFTAGTYIIRDGNFKIGSNARVSGSDVLFYLTGANSVMDFGSSAVVRFKGLTSGTQKGMVVWSATANNSNHKLGCSGMSYFEGAVYSPGTAIEINGAVNGSADWTAWVVRQVLMGSSSSLVINSNFSSSTTPMPTALSSGGMVYAATVAGTPRLIQ
jgi:Flp pilus assembly protein TadG